ncbi:hypothetical protein F4781DRAFT_435612 [Annulohypoxylon bovei var. microspora]|nr:hypothetical protein F4781DRAFT_435612 [Annulohypoxylon bovei var. microspora]
MPPFDLSTRCDVSKKGGAVAEAAGVTETPKLSLTALVEPDFRGGMLEVFENDSREARQNRLAWHQCDQNPDIPQDKSALSSHLQNKAKQSSVTQTLYETSVNMVRIAFLAFLAVAIPALASPISPDPAGAKNVGNGKGIQFIGGQCESSADCASTCCAVVTGQNFGLCSGLGAQTQAGKAGCGFGDGAAAATANTTAMN